MKVGARERDTVQVLNDTGIILVGTLILRERMDESGASLVGMIVVVIALVEVRLVDGLLDKDASMLGLAGVDGVVGVGVLRYGREPRIREIRCRIKGGVWFDIDVHPRASSYFIPQVGGRSRH